MLAGLNQVLNIGKTAHRQTRIDFQRFKLAGPSSRKSKRRLPDSGRTVKKNHVRIRFVGEVGSNSLLCVFVSNNSLKEFGTSSFAPHTLSSYPSRK
jgi:hypothetical protein